MEDLKDVCPVCSAQNINILEDMCNGCAVDMTLKETNEIVNNMFKSIDRYLFHK